MRVGKKDEKMWVLPEKDMINILKNKRNTNKIYKNRNDNGYRLGNR